MSRIRSTPSLILVAAVLAGCSSGTNPTGPMAPAGESVRTAGSAPANAEPFDDFVVPLVFGGDPRDGLAVAVGYENTVEQTCAGAEFVTSIGRGVLVHTGSGRIPIATITHEANAIVFDYGGGIVTRPCQQLLGAPVLATGRVTWSVQATDISNLAGTGPGAYGVYATAVGIVDLAAGGQARLFAKLHFQGLPDGTILQDEERVHLTPL